MQDNTSKEEKIIKCWISIIAFYPKYTKVEYQITVPKTEKRPKYIGSVLDTF